MDTSDRTVIGRNFPIHDAALKVTGQEIYTGDMRPAGLRYAGVLLSERAHARIRRIDADEALSMAGVYGVYTFQNAPDTLYNNYISFAGQQAPCDERLFDSHVRYVGDRVAAVVADSPEAVRMALQRIHVEYDELPAYTNCTRARAKNAVPIHEGGNRLSAALIQCGNAEAAMLADDGTSFSTALHLQHVHHAAMENHVCLANYDSLGRLTVFTPCQGAFGVRFNIASFLGLPLSFVRVKKMPTGGSFGGKQQTIIEILTSWLAYQTHGAVLLELERRGSMLGTSVATAFDFEILTKTTPEGRITAMDIHAQEDAGAYATNSAALLFSTGKKAFRLYRIPNMRFIGESWYTNTTPAGGFRGWGGPQIFAAMETHVDRLARSLHVDPVDFRMENLVSSEDEDPCIHLPLGNARIRECLQKGAEQFGWREKKDVAQRFNALPMGRYRRGVGVSCAAHVNGYAGSVHDFSTMTLRMNEDGSLTLNTAVHDQGCGSLTELAMIVSEILKIPMQRIQVLEADTDTSPYDMGTYASRATFVSGRCAFDAACSLQNELLCAAAELMNTEKDGLYIEHERVRDNAGEQSLTFSEIATQTQIRLNRELSVTQRYVSSTNPGSYGAHFAEVEVDTNTGLVRVLSYLAAHDLGCAINKQMVEGQIQGAVQMGIGYALTEEIAYNDKGVPTAQNFDKYTVVNAPDMPRVDVLILEYGGDEGPFGAKSIGEAALNPVPAAVVNAVTCALNLEMDCLPLSPKRVVAALLERKGCGDR